MAHRGAPLTRGRPDREPPLGTETTPTPLQRLLAPKRSRRTRAEVGDGSSGGTASRQPPLPWPAAFLLLGLVSKHSPSPPEPPLPFASRRPRAAQLSLSRRSRSASSAGPAGAAMAARVIRSLGRPFPTATPGAARAALAPYPAAVRGAKQ